MTTVAVVAEHRLLAEALTIQLEAEDDLSVVGNATDGHAAKELLARQQIDVVLLDIELRDEDALSLARNLREIRPAARLIILCGCSGPSPAAQAMDDGSFGWAQKDRPFAELLQVIRDKPRNRPRAPPSRLTGLLNMADVTRRWASEPLAPITDRSRPTGAAPSMSPLEVSRHYPGIVPVARLGGCPGASADQQAALQRASQP